MVLTIYSLSECLWKVRLTRGSTFVYGLRPVIRGANDVSGTQLSVLLASRYLSDSPPPPAPPVFQEEKEKQRKARRKQKKKRSFQCFTSITSLFS